MAFGAPGSILKAGFGDLFYTVEWVTRAAQLYKVGVSLFTALSSNLDDCTLLKKESEYLFI